MKKLFTNYIYLVTLFSSLLGTTIYAQDINYNLSSEHLKTNSNWILGFNGNSYLNFSDSSAISKGSISRFGTTSLLNIEGALMVSHPKTGALMFYYNGTKDDALGIDKGILFNRNQQQMLNGELKAVKATSTRQGVVAIPVPGDTNRHYVVQLGWWIEPAKQKLKYNIVDMRLDGGLGGIVDTAKNISLEKYFVDSANNLSEAMIVVPGNNCDAWLILHAMDLAANVKSKKYFVFHVTDKGISARPKEYPGSILGAISGVFKVSPDRKTLAYTNLAQSPFYNKYFETLEITKFDPDNGTITQPLRINIISDSNSYSLSNWDLEFSPNAKQLYLTQYSNDYGGNVLLQYNVSEHDSAKIVTSKATIYEGLKMITALKLHNGAIYTISNAQEYPNLGKIRYPDSSGVKCGYVDSILKLNELDQFFSNEIVYPMQKGATVTTMDTFCDIALHLEPADSTASNYMWQDGKTEKSRSIFGRNEGAYEVRYTTFANNCITLHIDSFYVKGKKELSQYPIISVSQENPNQLVVDTGFDSYQWYMDDKILNGATKNTLDVTENGNYKVAVTKNGCDAESSPYEVTNQDNGLTDFGIAAIKVYPNPVENQLFVRTPGLSSAHFQLYDLLGKSISTISTHQLDAFEWVLYTESLAPGVYILEIRDNNTGANAIVKVNKK